MNASFNRKKDLWLRDGLTAPTDYTSVSVRLVGGLDSK